jgi:L-threonylcarbamoyladenylate synthase
METVEAALAALRAGEPVLLATDTVYGLCVSPRSSGPVERINELKGRSGQPVALLAASSWALAECIPELSGRWRTLIDTLLPGPYTLVLPNPERRLPWLTPGVRTTIGVRVPVLPQTTYEVLERFGAVAATSANLHGESDPHRLEDVPERIREAVAVTVDAGELPGVASSVLDFSIGEPVVLRAGAGDPAEAIARGIEALTREG